MDVLLLVARLALAAVFAVAGVAKVMDLPGSRKAVREFGVPERFAGTAGIALPLAELAIALLLIPTATAWWGAMGALVLLALFIGAISLSLARGQTPDCHCFGQLHSEPAGRSTLVRNGILAALAAFVLLAGWSGPGASIIEPFEGLAAGELALLAGQVLLVGLVAGFGWATVQIMGQNGRMLARLDALEAAIAGGAPIPASTNTPRPTHGLPVGTPAPDFTLPDLAGNPVSLASLRSPDVQLLLLFTDPGCGPCGLVLQHVRQWREAAGRRLEIAVISQGDLTANLTKARQNGIDRVLLQKDRSVSGAYRADGTPSAVLVAADGTIAAPAAGGYSEIRDLVASVIGTDADPSLQPPKPALTGQAPDFRLPSLAGGEVTLDQLRAPGLPVLLHFTDPRCGPCYELLPDIGGWQRVYGDRLTLAVVSGGTPEVNRAMTAEYGIPADLVLLQSGPEVFEAFGQRQMPSVVIIDADGEVRQEPAYGAHAVRQRVADSLGLAMPEAPMRQRADPVAVGDKAPVFHRPDLDGIPYQVGGPTAGDTLLLFWNPGCPHCETLMPELKAWEADPEMPKIVVISRGPVALNQEMALASPVVLDDDRAIATAHGATGTPAAVVIDRLGMISSGVGRGASGVRALVHDLIAIGANGEPAVRVPDRE